MGVYWNQMDGAMCNTVGRIPWKGSATGAIITLICQHIIGIPFLLYPRDASVAMWMG